MKVGFIGLGHMGAGMVANLLGAGHDVTVYLQGLLDAIDIIVQNAYGFVPIIALAARAVIIPKGRFTSRR